MSQEVSKRYADSCKNTGRIGPVFTELDKLSKFGEANLAPDPLTISLGKAEGHLLDFEAVSHWCSIRANTAIFDKQFYYEC